LLPTPSPAARPTGPAGGSSQAASPDRENKTKQEPQHECNAEADESNNRDDLAENRPVLIFDSLKYRMPVACISFIAFAPRCRPFQGDLFSRSKVGIGDASDDGQHNE
jgi:hypothetical protein